MKCQNQHLKNGYQKIKLILNRLGCIFTHLIDFNLETLLRIISKFYILEKYLVLINKFKLFCNKEKNI